MYTNSWILWWCKYSVPFSEGLSGATSICWFCNSACIFPSCSTATQFLSGEWVLPHCVQSSGIISQGDLPSSNHMASHGGPVHDSLELHKQKQPAGTDSLPLWYPQDRPLVPAPESLELSWFLPFLSLFSQLLLQFCEYLVSFPNKIKIFWLS